MPCYLFTFHAYRSWMPDRPRGYVKRGEGVLPPDPAAARRYADRATDDEARFDTAIQTALVEELRRSAELQHFRLHATATDDSHLHILLSWPDARSAVGLRSQVKSSLSRRLKKQFGARKWLSKHGSRKRVRERSHFDHLINAYLPSHRGVFWREGIEDEEQ